MKKGKFGVVLPFYAVLAFVFSIFGIQLGALLVLGVALFVEKDEWASRQCMQAVFATMIVSCLGIIVNVLERIVMVFDYTDDTYEVFRNIINIVNGPIRLVLEIIVLILLLIGVTKVMRGQEANFPLLSTWAYKAYGYVQQVSAPVQQVPPQYPVQPQAPQQYPTQPQYPAQPPAQQQYPPQQPPQV